LFLARDLSSPYVEARDCDQRGVVTGEATMGEWLGVAIALVSSCLGGSAAAITRYLAGNTDPITMAILRWGIGVLCVLPAALLMKARWPARGDLPAVAALGFGFFGVFFVLYNIAISFTTAARASLALATLPLHTMVVGALLGIEPLTKRKSIGVGVAVLGVFAALAAGLSSAPEGAWRGELIMTAAVLCMAFYNVWSRPFIRRSSALGFLSVGMGTGAAALVLVGSFSGSFAALSHFTTPQWIAGLYLGIAGGALAFILWVLALERASPTRVATTMTVNPLAAGLLATQLVGEPITPNLVLGLVAVFAGIWSATTEAGKP
jgi:drug/metabolite transporter (DMT)-like permease